MRLLCTTTDGFVTSSHLLRGQGRRGNIETRNHAALSLVASCRAARLIALYDAWPTCSLREVRVAVAIAAEKCDKQQNMTSNRPCKGSDRKGNQVGRGGGGVGGGGMFVTQTYTHIRTVWHMEEEHTAVGGTAACDRSTNLDTLFASFFPTPYWRMEKR